MTLIYFILVLGLVVMIHELGHFIFAKRNGVYCHEFSIGMGPKLWSFKRKNDETTYSIRLFPIGGYVQMAGEELDDDEDINVPKEKSLQSKSVFHRFTIMVAGAFNNFVLGLVLLILLGLIYGGTNTKPIIKTVDKNYNAYKVKVEPGDTVKKVNGKKVYTVDDVMLEFQLTTPGSSIKFNLVTKDNVEKEVIVKPTKVTTDNKDSYIYGIEMDSTATHGFINSIKYGFSKFGSIYRSMIKVIGKLVTGGLGLNSLSGPVGIFNAVGEQAKAGFKNLIYFTAYISINVGFVNLIPFPAFDGGRALFLIIEKIRKKPINARVENAIHSVGFALLMILVVVITINDIIRLF